MEGLFMFWDHFFEEDIVGTHLCTECLLPTCDTNSGTSSVDVTPVNISTTIYSPAFNMGDSSAFNIGDSPIPEEEDKDVQIYTDDNQRILRDAQKNSSDSDNIGQVFIYRGNEDRYELVTSGVSKTPVFSNLTAPSVLPANDIESDESPDHPYIKRGLPAPGYTPYRVKNTDYKITTSNRFSPYVISSERSSPYNLRSIKRVNYSASKIKK